MDKVSRQRSYFVNLSAEVRTQVLSEACQNDKWELYHRTYAATVRRWLRVLKKSDLGELFNTLSQRQTVRPEGADHQWRKEPPRELSVDLVADERGGKMERCQTAQATAPLLDSSWIDKPHNPTMTFV